MSLDLEKRVRKANLVSRDDHLEQLFDDDLARHLLSDFYSKKEGRMSDTRDQQARPASSAPTDLSDGSASRRPAAKRPVMAWVLAGVGVLAVFGITWALIQDDQAEVAATPVETAEEFMTALNAHDVEAMLALTESEDVLGRTTDDGTIEFFRSEIEQEDVLGWTYEYNTCEQLPGEQLPGMTRVSCPYAFTNHITEVFGLGPYGVSVVTLGIEDGVVTLYNNHENSDEWQGEGGGLGLFYQWMVANHPEDAESFYYNYTDEANLDFWKEYIPLLLASAEG